MPDTIHVAGELRELLDPRILGTDMSWGARGAAAPTGPYTAIIPLVSTRVGAAEMDGLPNLRIVAICGVGTDTVDLGAAFARRIAVTNTPDVLTESTADLTWALILGATRRVREGELLLRAGWTGWDPSQLLGIELNGSTLGIIGAGRIGMAVARRALGFGMRVVYNARQPNVLFDGEIGASLLHLDALLAQSDVVSLHVPMTPDTRGMMSRARIDAMKPGSVLVNAARGGLVDETALLDALDRGHLQAAGLDVFEGEPAVEPRLLAHPRIFALPHLGSATWGTRRAMANLAARNVRAHLEGAELLTPVHD